jgi:hypothetical protein
VSPVSLSSHNINIMAAWLVKSFLPVVSKVKFGRNVPRNLDRCKNIYPEASMYIL